MTLEDYIRNQEKKLGKAAERGKETVQNAWQGTKDKAKNMTSDIQDSLNG